ncbi:hypothetical protein [Pedobacter zeae]|uniref:Putative Co/Zn/Cd cation transporter (Cation efflux family) n=1 Tax=Pedobacter zeae TaxID=1737356 RepID=A0A7W6KH00_9SPHI|nr:hypothetical protein [Pedobacter zeae]MBB4110357.1 putative Co/Zn/Cd cation transporter (cation efflux family) [Pedobacter zeae]
MKQALTYTLKVTLTTLLFCLPVTFVIMMGFVRLLPLIFSNYSFSVHLDIRDAVVFVILTFCALLFYMRKIRGASQLIYNKRNIAINAMMASIAVFLIYLWLCGKLMSLSISEFLITYAPTFSIAFVCMRIYPLKNEENETKLV